MSSISARIDAAVVGDKRRAAEFDDAGRLPMDEWLERDSEHAVLKSLFDRAESNLLRARIVVRWAPFGQFDEERRKCLHDARNLIALILSVNEVAPAKEGSEP